MEDALRVRPCTIDLGIGRNTLGSVGEAEAVYVVSEVREVVVAHGEAG